MTVNLATSHTYRGGSGTTPAGDTGYFNLTPEQVFEEFNIISANETPILGTLATFDIYNAIYSWQMDDISRPTSINQSTPDGDIDAQAIPVRPIVSNSIHNLVQSVEVTRLARSLSVRGMADPFWAEVSRLIAKLAMQFDAELLFSQYQAGSVGTADPSVGTGWRMNGLLDWAVTTGAARSTSQSTWTLDINSGISSTFASYWKVLTTAMTEDDWNDMLQGSYELGNSIPDSIVHVSPTVKRVLSELNLEYVVGATNQSHTVPLSRVQQEMNRRNVSMDLYNSDFGLIGIVINRNMNDTLLSNRTFDDPSTSSAGVNFADVYGSDFILGFDKSYLRAGYVDGGFFYEPLHKSTKDATKGMVGATMGLRVGNPKCLFGMSNIGGTHDV